MYSALSTFIFISTLIHHVHPEQLQRGATLLEPKDRNGEPVTSGHAERKCPGSCMSPAACAIYNGVNRGGCVDGSICCQFARSCGDSSNQLLSYFQSPDYPMHTNVSLSCPLLLHPLPQVTALRIDFEVFEMDEPRKYGPGIQKCILDTFFVLNTRGGPLEGICAMANYSSVLYFKDGQNNNLTLLFVMQSTHWRWRLKLTQLNSSRIPVWTNMPGCGRQLMYEESPLTNQSHPNAIPQRLIVNGERAGGSEFPWQVSIQVPPNHRCGGSVLNHRFVLTAAHCFADDAYLGEMSELRVVVGGENLNSSALDSIPVDSIIMNYEYKAFHSHLNDIAVLHLSRDVQFSPHVQPICLPAKDITFEGREGVVSGWGRLNGSSNGPRPMHLQKVNVRVLGQSDCLERGQREVGRLSRNQSTEFELDSSQICALAPENATVCFVSGTH